MPRPQRRGALDQHLAGEGRIAGAVEHPDIGEEDARHRNSLRHTCAGVPRGAAGHVQANAKDPVYRMRAQGAAVNHSIRRVAMSIKTNCGPPWRRGLRPCAAAIGSTAGASAAMQRSCSGLRCRADLLHRQHPRAHRAAGAADHDRLRQLLCRGRSRRRRHASPGLRSADASRRRGAGSRRASSTSSSTTRRSSCWSTLWCLSRLPYLVAFVLFEAATLIPYLLVARRVVGEAAPGVLLILLGFRPCSGRSGWDERVLDDSAIRRRTLAHRSPAGCRGSALRRALLQAAYRAAHSGGARGWRTLARLRRRVGDRGAARARLGPGIRLPWRDFLVTATTMHGTYESGRIDFAGFVSPFGGVRLLGGSPPLARSRAATLASAALVGFVCSPPGSAAARWRRSQPRRDDASRWCWSTTS